MSVGPAGPTRSVAPAGPPVAVRIGPPGAGKSTIGKRVAQALEVEIFDTDIAIEERSGRTIPDIFEQDGEQAFRELEEQVVLDTLRTRGGVVSLGGGAILSPRTRAALLEHCVVYLEISVAEGLRRTRATSRPILAGEDPRKKYQDLMRHRRPLYREVADIRVRTEGRSPARVAQAVVDHLARLGLVVPVAGAAAVDDTDDAETGGVLATGLDAHTFAEVSEDDGTDISEADDTAETSGADHAGDDRTQQTTGARI